MQATTLYYYFSTIAQTLAATSALLAVFTQFKINEIRDFLIGNGMAIYERMKLKEDGYHLSEDSEHKKYSDRLKDSIGRKSIPGIKEVIGLLSSNEKDQKKTLLTNPRGLQYLERRFNEIELQLNTIKSVTRKSIILAFVTILITLISIIFVEIIKNYGTIYSTIIFIIFTTTFCSMLFTIKGVLQGLKDMDDI